MYYTFTLYVFLFLRFLQPGSRCVVCIVVVITVVVFFVVSPSSLRCRCRRRRITVQYTPPSASSRRELLFPHARCRLRRPTPALDFRAPVSAPQCPARDRPRELPPPGYACEPKHPLSKNTRWLKMLVGGFAEEVFWLVEARSESPQPTGGCASSAGPVRLQAKLYPNALSQ